MKYFTFQQFAYSDTAITKNIDNSVPSNLQANAKELVEKILDPLVIAWGSDIIMTSGYRCHALNEAVGSKSDKSAHCWCYAADLVPKNGRIEEFKDFVMKWLLNNNIAFDQYINEYDGNKSWVHIAIRNREGLQRRQYLLYYGGTCKSINPTFFKGINSQTNTSNIANTQQGDENGVLKGNSVYLKDIDLEAIKSNGIFDKDESGEPLINENGDFVISDSYLLKSTENTSDEISDISDIETMLLINSIAIIL